MEEALRRLRGERALERHFATQLAAAPDRMGLQSCLEVHSARRLEAELACERLCRRQDEAVASAVGQGGRRCFAAMITKGAS